MAQDPFFSHFFKAPMTINPALLGNDMDKDFKVSLITRNKWWGENSKPFTTNALSVEKQVTTNTNYFNLMYIGVQMLNERSGDGVLTNSYFGATLNDKIKITEKDFISSALSFSYANRLVDINAATFQSQFGSFGFMPTAVNYDPISLVSNKYFDMNAGLSLDHFVNNNLNYQFGFAMFHVNKPSQSGVNKDGYRLDMRTVVNGSLNYTFNNLSSLYIGTNVQKQGVDQIFTIGGNYMHQFSNQNNLKLTLGLWNRVNEALYPYIGLKYNDLNIGLSYDIPTKEIRSRVSSASSIEANLTWDFGKQN